jgi:hypothetical protein
MRVVQSKGTRGSLKWIQRAVALRPDLLKPKALAEIKWVSPLESDDFAEYRDGAFLDRLGFGHLRDDLASFWPSRGPQWDALGLSDGIPVLVEAKAHIREFMSPASHATAAASRDKITKAFNEVRRDLEVHTSVDWLETFYQFTNRLAHLWWFRKRHNVDAHLVFVSFLNDADMDGPHHEEAWEAAFDVARFALGLPKRHGLSAAIHHVMPDVRLLS